MGPMETNSVEMLGEEDALRPSPPPSGLTKEELISVLGAMSENLWSPTGKLSSQQRLFLEKRNGEFTADPDPFSALSREELEIMLERVLERLVGRREKAS